MKKLKNFILDIFTVIKTILKDQLVTVLAVLVSLSIIIISLINNESDRFINYFPLITWMIICLLIEYMYYRQKYLSQYLEEILDITLDEFEILNKSKTASEEIIKKLQEEINNKNTQIIEMQTQIDSKINQNKN